MDEILSWQIFDAGKILQQLPTANLQDVKCFMGTIYLPVGRGWGNTALEFISPTHNQLKSFIALDQERGKSYFGSLTMFRLNLDPKGERERQTDRQRQKDRQKETEREREREEKHECWYFQV